MVSSRREVICSRKWKKIHENKLRHTFQGSWACVSTENFARGREFEFEEASTRRPQLLIFDWKWTIHARPFDTVKWGWLADTTSTVRDICTFAVLFLFTRPFLALHSCLKGTSCCVIMRNFKWNWAVRSCFGKVLQVISLHDFRCYLLSVRGVWHLCNLPRVYALFWLISIASYVFESPSICIRGISLFLKSRKPLL